MDYAKDYAKCIVTISNAKVQCNPDPVKVKKGTANGIQWTLASPGYIFRGVLIDNVPAPTGDFGPPQFSSDAGRSVMDVSDSVDHIRDFSYTPLFADDKGHRWRVPRPTSCRKSRTRTSQRAAARPGRGPQAPGEAGLGVACGCQFAGDRAGLLGPAERLQQNCPHRAVIGIGLLRVKGFEPKRPSVARPVGRSLRRKNLPGEEPAGCEFAAIGDCIRARILH